MMTQTQVSIPARPFSDVTVQSQDLSWLDFLQGLSRVDPRAMQALLMCLALKTLDGERVHVLLPDNKHFQAWKAEPSKQLLLPAALQREQHSLTGALVLTYTPDERQWMASIHT